MKIAVLGDLHRGYGYSKDQGSEDLGKKIEKSQDDFFDMLLIPYMEANNIGTIIQTGDVYEQEYILDSRTISSTIDLFKYKLGKYDIHVVTGNHDIYYNDDRTINSLKTIENKNVSVWNEVSAAEIGGKSILLCPWLVKDEHAKLEEYITKKKPDIVVGHFEIKDMPMYKNRPSNRGFHPSLFTDNVKLTISGHYHTISNYTSDNGNNLVYVGTPYCLNHNDDDEIRGFWILDTEDLSMSFIENTYSKKFTTVSDVGSLEKYESLNNYFVRILTDPSTSIEDASLFRKAIDEKAPFFSKSRPSGNIAGVYVPIENIKQDDIVARALGGDDMVNMASTYINVLSMDEDMKQKMIARMHVLRDEIRGKKQK
jgi:DNA repair exonuclease SbcCD nuclease subunit